MGQNISVCLTFDFDAMSVWLGTFGATSPSVISRGEFGKVGTERLLTLLYERGIRSTWFIPGHTVETFPDLVQRIAAEGHEVGHHGYCHENPAVLSLEKERKFLERGIDAISTYVVRVDRGTPYLTFDIDMLYGYNGVHGKNCTGSSSPWIPLRHSPLIASYPPYPLL